MGTWSVAPDTVSDQGIANDATTSSPLAFTERQSEIPGGSTQINDAATTYGPFGSQMHLTKEVKLPVLRSFVARPRMARAPYLPVRSFGVDSQFVIFQIGSSEFEQSDALTCEHAAANGVAKQTEIDTNTVDEAITQFCADKLAARVI
jgi:hypothetical protein